MGRLEFNKDKILLVDIEEVRPNTWNPKPKDTDEFKKIKKGIELKGLRLPVIVRESEGFEIIDGEQRYTAAKELGFEKILVYNEGEISDKEAKELTVWYQQQVPFDSIDEAYFVAELVAKYQDTYELPYTEAEIAEFEEIANFDFSQYDPTQYEGIDEDGLRTLKLVLGEQAYNVIMQAIEKAKDEADNISTERAIELICADYLGA